MTGPKPRIQVAPMDVDHLARLRANIARFLTDAAAVHAARPCLVLDVAPQDNGGARPFLPDHAAIETLDIDPAAGCTWTADLCRTNPQIPDMRFDLVVCTEVLEHTLQPFAAIAELRRVMKPGAVLLLSTPFNFRIHGPLPDCWRFTEHGLRALLADFEILGLEPLETPDRPLMPIQYTVVARRPMSDGNTGTAR